MAIVAQLVRALDCGSGGRGFESHHSPQKLKTVLMNGFFFIFHARFQRVRRGCLNVDKNLRNHG